MNKKTIETYHSIHALYKTRNKQKKHLQSKISSVLPKIPNINTHYIHDLSIVIISDFLIVASKLLIRILAGHG